MVVENYCEKTYSNSSRLFAVVEIKPGMPAWFYRSSGMNHKAGRTESIDILAEAYENFIDLVNKYGLEMEKEIKK